MTAASHRPDRPWPPLIVATDVPRAVRWRDTILTLLMWALFLFALETEFQIVLERLGWGSYDVDYAWSDLVADLMPFLWMIGVLVVLIFGFALETLRRRRRALELPQPAPLASADQARRAGMDEAALAAARTWRIAVVHIDPDGRHRIEPREPPG